MKNDNVDKDEAIDQNQFIEELESIWMVLLNLLCPMIMIMTPSLAVHLHNSTKAASEPLLIIFSF